MVTTNSRIYIMRLYSLLLAILVICSEIRTGESTADGCNSNPCGNGADCQTMDNFAIVCVCPTGTVGDPFVACRPSPTSATSTTSGTSMSTSSHMVPVSSSSGMTMVHSQSLPSSSSPVMTTATTSSSSSSTNGGSLFPMETSNVRNDHTVVTKMSHMYNNPISYHPEKIYGSSSASSSSSPSTSSHDSHSSSSYIHRDDTPTTTNNNNHRNVIVHSSNLDNNNYNDGHRHRVHPHEDSNSNNYGHHGHNSMNYQHRNTENNNYPYSTSSTYGENNNYAVKDPLGVYSNCKSINNVIVCADESDSDSKHHSGGGGQNSFQNDYSHRSSLYDDSNGRQKYNHGPSSSSSSGHRQEFGFSSNYDDSPKYSSNGGHNNNYNNNNDNVPKPVPGDSETCKKYCGLNAICRTLLGRPICGCPEGTTGDPSMSCVPAEDQMKMTNRCEKHTECSETMICQEGQCLDPCNHNNDHQTTKTSTVMDNSPPAGLRNNFAHFHRTRGERSGSSMMMTTMTCGANAKCQVIRHTQLCGCLDGFSGNPYNGCVPSAASG